MSGRFVREFNKYIGRRKKEDRRRRTKQMDYSHNVPPSSDTEGVRIKLAEHAKCSAFLLIVLGTCKHVR